MDRDQLIQKDPHLPVLISKLCEPAMQKTRNMEICSSDASESSVSKRFCSWTAVFNVVLFDHVEPARESAHAFLNGRAGRVGMG